LAFRLMCITAHPDDESASFGGALLMAHARGVETSVCCLTDGQAARHRGEATDDEDLARRRRAEFAAACEVLGVTRHEVLCYPDGGLAQCDFYEMTGEIARRIRELKPQVVLTFGGEGSVNLHRDHTMTSLVATAAFHWAGRDGYFPEQLARGLTVYAPQKLYFACPPFVIGRDQGEMRLSATAARTPWSLTLELGEHRHKKLEAFKKHSTQLAVIDRVGDLMDKVMESECFLLAAARVEQAVEADSAMFAGVIDE
jgi:LmbE family N-acetylglucosaminyl deacetylase